MIKHPSVVLFFSLLCLFFIQILEGLKNNSIMQKGETSSSNTNKLERKIIEKNRRVQMKDLCFKLVSMIPDHHFNPGKEFLSQQDQIEQAANYIKILKERVEELRTRKTQLALMKSQSGTNEAINKGGSELPVLKIRESGSSLEVVLISGIRKHFMLNQVISIMEHEGAEVVSVNLSNIGDKSFHTLHAKVKVSRVGMDTLRICEKIQELIS